MATKMIRVALAATFLNAIVLDTDPAHPGGVAHIVRDSKSDEPPVYEVAETAFIKGKIREGVLEEVRDFTGTPYNDPESVAARQAAVPPTTGLFTQADVQKMIAQAAADAKAVADASNNTKGKTDSPTS